MGKSLIIVALTHSLPMSSCKPRSWFFPKGVIALELKHYLKLFIWVCLRCLNSAIYIPSVANVRKSALFGLKHEQNP